MITVSHDPNTVESQLLSQELLCPQCRGPLRRWGFGVQRIIRCGTPAQSQRFTPRRARCHDCHTTQILLPVMLAARRADDAAVIAHAVELNIVEGLGFRKIAVVLDRPETTVRGWLRVLKAKASDMAVAFTARVHRGTADALGFWPAPASTAGATALGMLIAHARMLAHQHGAGPNSVPNVPWHRAAFFAHGPWFFSKVGWPEPVQHQPALPLEG